MKTTKTDQSAEKTRSREVPVTARLREDVFLRRPPFRFSILERPVGGVPVWQRWEGGKWVKYTHYEALAKAREILKAKGDELHEAVASGDDWV